VSDAEFGSDAELRSRRAGSFGAAAAIYERARPGYPDDALDWLLPGGSPRVLDLGAGTGKLTRLIAARGLDVTAVEPSDGMREQLHEALPGVTALNGSAEQIPLDDASVDVVLVAQAWHWVDVPRASVEVARVLAVGGRLGLIWNHGDERVAWVRELGEIVAHGVDQADRANPIIGKPFGQIEHFVTEWSSTLTPATLVDLVASRSALIIASDSERAGTLTAVQQLIDSHPALAGRDEFELPYITYCSRAHVA
jgi:SAM-dependent methyltransferase